MSDWFWFVLTLGAALMAVGFALSAKEKKKKKSFCAKTEAVIIDVMQCDRAGTRFRAVYEYAAHGMPVRVPGGKSADDPDAFTVGRKVVIRYDPHRPTEFIPAKSFDKETVGLLLGICGIAAVGLSFLL